MSEILSLIERTRPGPFLARTIELVTYLGIRRDGALVAMAGERLHPPGWTEISAVCTDPAFRGPSWGCWPAVLQPGVADRRADPRYAWIGIVGDEEEPMTNAPFDPHALLAESRLGVLATIKRDGRPQLSPVLPFYDRPAGVIHISMAEGRAKTANLRRDPRATLEVTSPDGSAWATAEGTATLIGPGTDPHGPQVAALVDYYRRAAGEHPDWDEYRAAMVSERRVLMTMTLEHVYGARIR